MKPGEKLMQCLVCDHEQTADIGERVQSVKCELCRRGFMRVLEVQPSTVRGVGWNPIADLGLALLMEAGEGDTDG